MSKKNIAKKSATNWEKVDALSDADIDLGDIPELDRAFFKKARVVLPRAKVPITLRVDAEVLEWYKSQGSRYQTLMHAVLKEYTKAGAAHK